MSLKHSALSIIVLSFLATACSSHKKSVSDARSVETNTSNPVLFEEEYEAQRRGELPEQDFPMVQNAKVETWLNYFQGRGSKWFRIWMERSGRYIPFMKRILREHGLPEDLVYLAMIESGFSPRAYSSARAVGYWQFMRATGRRYGLRVNFWVDERRDPEKATIAAARHLKDLFDQFQDWKLAAAAYNAGAGRISRAMRRYRTEDFWELSKHRHLAAETRNYVPKLIAAAMIAKDPARYGFEDIDTHQPLQYEKVTVKRPVNLRKLASKTGVSFEDLWYINPELNHAVTPPGTDSYDLRVPAKKSESFMAAIDKLEPEEMFQYASHQVRKGDSVRAIARRYAVPAADILALNNLKSSSVRVGTVLLLPLPLGAEPPKPVRDRQAFAQRVARKASPASASVGDELYVVQRGDSLWSISRELGVTVESLKNVNEFDGNALRAGQRIKVPGSGGEAKKSKAFRPEKVVHVVRRGETLTQIALKYGTTVLAIQAKNGLRQSRLVPGNRLQIPRT